MTTQARRGIGANVPFKVVVLRVVVTILLHDRPIEVPSYIKTISAKPAMVETIGYVGSSGNQHSQRVKVDIVFPIVS